MYGFYNSLDYLKDVTIDGFSYAEITEHFDSNNPNKECLWGDAAIKTPSSGYVSLSWKIGENPHVDLVSPPTPAKTGFAYFTFTKPIKNIEDLLFNFKETLPLLKKTLEENNSLE